MRAEAVSNTTTVITSGTKKLVAISRPFAAFSPFSAYQTNGDIRIGLTTMSSATTVNVVEHERPTPRLAAADADWLTARNTNHSLCPKAAAIISGVRHTQMSGEYWVRTRALSTQYLRKQRSGCAVPGALGHYSRYEANRHRPGRSHDPKSLGSSIDRASSDTYTDTQAIRQKRLRWPMGALRVAVST